ncbi:MAG: hypothetical protein U9R74_18945 [Pseudomonadota bacterium]|nr:hypothetical protein [Pseudomonadota bacterium]
MRSALLVFVAGWVVWFWLDKEGPFYTMARNLPSGDSLARDFQIFFDLLRSGDVGPAYTYFWSAHPFVSTLVVAGAYWLAVPLFRYGSGALRNRRRRKSPAAAPARSKSASEDDADPSPGEDSSRIL